MNCHQCAKKLESKSWLHLFKTTDTYLCCYSCVKKSDIKGYWDYIVNTEDYAGIINPYMSNPYILTDKNNFNFMTPNEIDNLSVLEKVNYQKEYDEYVSLNPEKAAEEYHQMMEELYINEIEEEYYISDSDSDGYTDDY